MKWTKTAPTAPGWYWTRRKAWDGEDGNRYPPGDTEMVVVEDRDGALRYTDPTYIYQASAGYNGCWGEHEWSDMEYAHQNEWSGPIPEPEEE
ncbi:MAG: hypothetical protein GY944_04575 [bacterium]|nr:hypothetical protein [bacterium]